MAVYPALFRLSVGALVDLFVSFINDFRYYFNLAKRLVFSLVHATLVFGVSVDRSVGLLVGGSVGV